jgi:hypothetical protein
MLYIIQRGHWCHIIVLNVHAPTEDKTDDVKDSFNEELERVFDKFPKYHTKIVLGDFNAKVGREYIFKPTIGNESLHKISNDIGNEKIKPPLFTTISHCVFIIYVSYYLFRQHISHPQVYHVQNAKTYYL